jgi:hypothetical protein
VNWAQFLKTVPLYEGDAYYHHSKEAKTPANIRIQMCFLDLYSSTKHNYVPPQNSDTSFVSVLK